MSTRADSNGRVHVTELFTLSQEKAHFEGFTSKLFTWKYGSCLNSNPSSCKLTEEKNYEQTSARKTQAQHIVEDKHPLEDEQTLKHMMLNDLKLSQKLSTVHIYLSLGFSSTAICTRIRKNDILHAIQSLVNMRMYLLPV